MRKLSNVLISLAALAVCGLVTYFTLGSGRSTLIFNLSVLALMLVIIFFSWSIGFLRIGRTIRGMQNASDKLEGVFRERTKLSELTRQGTQLFEVGYLDRKYQEFLGYLRRTNSPTDIGEYIGDVEISNYIHRRLLEMVPDVLTSLGILGTFIGLVWGLQGFDPNTMESMATSITALVDGIKVAFVTSIYGLALSLAYNYSLKNRLLELSESVNDFTDMYYLCAVPPTDTAAMSNVLANQKEQLGALQNLNREIAAGMSESMTTYMSPMMDQLNQTMVNFTDVITMHQRELLESIASQVAGAMFNEFSAEFSDMRTSLKETVRAQKDYLDYLSRAQAQLDEDMKKTARDIGRYSDSATARQDQSAAAMQAQQQYMSDFASYMNSAMQAMADLQKETLRSGEAVTKQINAMEELTRKTSQFAASAGKSAQAADEAALRAEKPERKTRIDDIDELTDRMDQMILLLERQEKMLRESSKKKGLFR